MAARERVSGAVDSARPYVERLAKDDELHEHVKSAYESARRVYDEVIGDRGPAGVAMRVARDKDLQEELRRTLDELRDAGKRLQTANETHTARNVALLLTGIALGILFNPMTGPDTRRWLKDRVFGPEEPFDSYQSSEQQA